MAQPALVLVHGGGLAADSWELTVEQIHKLAPELTVVMDMPGRRDTPGELRELTIVNCVDSLVGDIETAGLEDMVIVAHSMGAAAARGVPSLERRECAK